MIADSEKGAACRSARGVILAATLLVLLAAGGVVEPGDEGKPAPSAAADARLSGTPRAAEAAPPPLVAPGPPPDIVILFTGRVVGFVEPCG